MQSDYSATGGTDETSRRSVEDLAEQVAELRAQLQGILAQLEQLTAERVAPAAAGVASRAEEAVLQAGDFAQAKLDAIAEDVRERPLTALLLAAAVGYVAGRVSR